MHTSSVGANSGCAERACYLLRQVAVAVEELIVKGAAVGQPVGAHRISFGQGEASVRSARIVETPPYVVQVNRAWRDSLPHAHADVAFNRIEISVLELISIGVPLIVGFVKQRPVGRVGYAPQTYR